MARARYESSEESSDDELPALSDILNRRRNAKPIGHQSLPLPGHMTKPSSPGAETAGHAARAVSFTSVSRKLPEPAVPSLVQKANSTPVAPKRQRVLKSASMDNRLARPVTAETIGSISSLDENGESFRRRSPIAKRTPARAAKKTSQYLVGESSDASSMVQADSACSSDSDSESEFESDEGIDGDPRSASHSHFSDLSTEDVNEEAARQPHSLSTNTQESKLNSAPLLNDMSQDGLASGFSIPAYEITSIDASTAPPVLRKPESSSIDLERPPSSSSADLNAILTYSPPRRISPHKVKHHSDRPYTPPPLASPGKSGLLSSKKSRIPTPPHRPSLDAFWSAEVVNSWNDLHSPRKTLESPQKPKFTSLSDEQAYQMPPQKKSPAKKDTTRRSFEQRKHQLAQDFLEELDMTITKGQISLLTAESGGVKLVWSKTLSTTAGRANWKKESMKVRENGMFSAHHKHHASIELAEKVIDDEDRLINVIAHEFCHLTNFMISNVRDNPHGKEFKEWAKKVTRAFSHRNVNVTTKHAYAIDYKYVWTCVSCGHEFKRHSKSIDPTKHRCGSCKSELVQTKPAVRRKDPNKGPNGYQVFMKENFQRIKRENEGKSHKDIMEIVGREYKETKIKQAKQVDVEDGLRGVTRAVEAITLGN